MYAFAYIPHMCIKLECFKRRKNLILYGRVFTGIRQRFVLDVFQFQRALFPLFVNCIYFN